MALLVVNCLVTKISALKISMSIFPWHPLISIPTDQDLVFVYVDVKYTYTSRLVSKLKNFKHFVYSRPYNIVSMWLLKEFTFNGNIKSNDIRKWQWFQRRCKHIQVLIIINDQWYLQINSHQIIKVANYSNKSLLCSAQFYIALTVFTRNKL